MGVGTLFRNFPIRLDLVEAMYQEDLVTLATLASELAETHGPWDALVEWQHAFVGFSQAKRTNFDEINQAFERNPAFAQHTRD